ncbi:hypothetical protein ABZQ47_20935, partial [Pseudomonas aeruginosa]
MQLGHTSAAPSSAGILRRTAPTIETGRSPDPAPEGQKIGSGGEMRAQRTHETQAERDDHPEEKEGQNQGRARSIPSRPLKNSASTAPTRPVWRFFKRFGLTESTQGLTSGLFDRFQH